MRKTCVAPSLLVCFAACAAPRLPAPPGAELRAQWASFELAVLPFGGGFAVEGPPTSLFGRMLVGAERGFAVGCDVDGWAGAAGVVALAACAAAGTVGGLVVGPFCGASADELDAERARLEQAVKALPPRSQLELALRGELQARGTWVVARSDVRCEVQLADCGLRGPTSFDPALGLELAGVLTMRRDGAVQHVLPFAWRGPARPYSEWKLHPEDLAGAVREAAAQIATFLADELLCTVDVAWRAERP